MEKLGSGFITTTDDVDRLEFDWGKIHFLSEPQVTNAERFSFGIVELAKDKGTHVIIIPARKRSSMSFPDKASKWWTINPRLRLDPERASISRPIVITLP